MNLCPVIVPGDIAHPGLFRLYLPLFLRNPVELPILYQMAARRKEQEGNPGTDTRCPEIPHPAEIQRNLLRTASSRADHPADPAAGKPWREIERTSHRDTPHLHRRRLPRRFRRKGLPRRFPRKDLPRRFPRESLLRLLPGEFQRKSLLCLLLACDRDYLHRNHLPSASF